MKDLALAKFTRRLLLPALVLGLGLGSPMPVLADGVDTEASSVRLLVPPGRQLEGKVELEALVIDTDVHKLVFYIDGEEVAQRKRPPWNVKVRLASPAKEQIVEVEAHGKKGKMGRDTVVVNRFDPPLRVRLEPLTNDQAAGLLKVRGEVSVPRKGALEKVEIYLNQERVGMALAREFAVDVPWPTPNPQDFVRAVAILEDGRAVEDVQLVTPPANGLAEEIDVNLVQLQTVVTRRSGAPVTDLTLEDFAIEQGGEDQKIERLFVAEDVALVLGLVLDSSGSMDSIWGATREAAEQFLSQTLGRRDRAFVVDFDQQLELVAPLSGDVDELVASLDAIEPEGGTALYDSVLFSLLQFRDEPGRRALVVLTDGFDVHSTAKPKRAVEFGRKLGVPVYVIALDDPSLGGVRPEMAMALSTAVQELKLLTEPTGGRLIRVQPNANSIDRAFRQIHHELRHQYILTYYTEELPDDRKQAVEVTVPGRKGVEVRAVFGLDQIY